MAVMFAACSRGPSADSVRNAAVATAGGQTLTGTVLEQWLLASRAQPNAVNASVLVSNWIDETLLAAAMHDGDSLVDSATIAAAITPDAARGMALKFWQVRAAARPAITDKQADSLLTVDRMRVFQHLLLRLPPNPDSATMQDVARRAADLERRANGGEDFAALVRKYSDDTAGRGNGGYMPPVSKAQIPTNIAGAMWALHPGELGSLVHSPAGVELYRRATADESRPLLKQWLGPQLARRADSIYSDSLARAHHLTVPGDAPARLRTMAQEPVTGGGTGPMMTWDGGSLSPDQTRMWLMMLSPAVRAVMTEASDSATKAFLRELGTRELVVGEAAPKGPVSPDAWTALMPQYKAELTAVQNDLRHAGAALAPGALAESYIDSILAGTMRYRLLPGELAGVLRARAKVSVDQDAMTAVVHLAQTGWSVKHANDSTPRP